MWESQVMITAIHYENGCKAGRINCTAPGSEPRPKLKVPLGIYSHISLRSGKFKLTMNTGRSIPPSTTTLVLLPGLIPTGILAPQLVMRAATVPPQRAETYFTTTRDLC